jgi:hypothetical protein
MNNSEIICPFCGEGDFDLIGLKDHLTNVDRLCSKFVQTLTIEEERKLREIKHRKIIENAADLRELL